MSGHREPRLHCLRGTQWGSAAERTPLSQEELLALSPITQRTHPARMQSPHPDPLWDTPKDTQKSPTGLCPVTLPSDARCSPDADSHTIAALAFHPPHTSTHTHARTRGLTFVSQGRQPRGTHMAECTETFPNHSQDPIHRRHRPHRRGTTLPAALGLVVCATCPGCLWTLSRSRQGTGTHTPACPRCLGR